MVDIFKMKPYIVDALAADGLALKILMRMPDMMLPFFEFDAHG